jgi:hypothetical protein
MLPLDNLGLEQLDIVVPDPAAAARSYARIFKTTPHQQPVRDTLRYFVLLGDLPQDRQVGWFHLEGGTRIGLQQAEAGRSPTIEHFAIRVTPFRSARAGGATARDRRRHSSFR